MEIKRVNFVADTKKDEVVGYVESLTRIFQTKGVECNVYPVDAQLVLVVGGDGTMLEAKERYWQYSYQTPLLGLNFGYKGFLMNNPFQPSEVVQRVVDGKFKSFTFPLLNITTDCRKHLAALNDVYFYRVTPKNCKMTIKVNGISIAERISGDGFIIGTALGSTGYNFAARGPAVYPELPVIVLTPSNLHAPIQLGTTIFPLKSKVEIEILNLYQEDVKAGYDGFDLPFLKKAEIIGGDYWIKLAFWEEENFIQRLVDKMMKIQEV